MAFNFQKDKLVELRKLLQEGEKSGFVENYNPNEHLIALQNKHQQG